MQRRLFLFAIFLLSTTSVSARTLYAFIGADTYSSLKYSCEKDYASMCKKIRNIAKLTKMKLHLTNLSAKELTPHNLVSWLEKIEPKKDDVVFFYFSGHGKKGPNKWPALYFTPKRMHILFSEIIKLITKKKAGLSVILCDVCNGRRVYHSLSQSYVGVKTEETKQEAKGLKKLFRKKKGVIIGSASKSGQQAFGTIQGGIFTNAFLCGLRQEALQNKPKWKHLFEKTHSLCIRTQKPKIEIELD